MVTAVAIRSDMASVSDAKVTWKVTERRNACYTENDILTRFDPTLGHVSSMRQDQLGKVRVRFAGLRLSQAKREAMQSHDWKRT